MGRVLILKTVDKDGKAYGGFRWPKRGKVVAPDWNKRPECGGGLHGLLWGCGDGSLLSTDTDARWLVFSADDSELVDIGGKVKAPAGSVVHCGTKDTAVQYLLDHGAADKPVVFRTSTSGYGGTSTSGNGGTSTSGNYGTSTSGDGGTSTSGNYGTSTSGNGGTAFVSHQRQTTVPSLPEVDVEMTRGALLSEDSLYRYRLWRRWGWGPRMVWVMLNPSTADAEVDDPTIRRCIGFAKREGFAAIDVINLFALRATKPAHLLDHPEPEGPLNASEWANTLTSPHLFVVAAWGAHAKRVGFGWRNPTYQEFTKRQHNGNFKCLGTTADGSPRHPLYVKGDQEFVEWS